MSRDADESQEEGGAQSSRPGLPVDFHRLLRAANRGKWWLVLSAVIGAGVGGSVGKFAVKHTYESTATIRYEGMPGQSAIEAQRDLPSLVSITHSEPMMRRLRERLELWAANLDAMRQLARVEADAASGLVSFTGSGGAPEDAARMANVLVELFLEHHRERRSRELSTEVASLVERIRAAEAERVQARGAYDDFRNENEINDLSAEQEQAITQAAERRSQADLAQAEIQALEARITQLRATLERTPRTTSVSEVSDEARQVRELRARLQRARSNLSDEHPEVQALQRQLYEAQTAARSSGGSTRSSTNPLHEQLSATLATAETELEGARRRQAVLEQLAQQAQGRTNRFSTIEGQAATLLADVNVKEALVTELQQQKARVEDQLRDVQTGFRSVAEARPPENAIPSKKKYLVAAGIPAAFMAIMLGMLLFRELRGLRVQTPAEVAFWGKGPVIGTTTWPRDPRALIDLIADMDDFAPEAKGTMLVIGSTEGERELAGEIAGQLNHDWSSNTLIDVPLMGSLAPPKQEFASLPGNYLDDDGPVVGELDEGPTAMILAPADPYGIEIMDGPTLVSGLPPPPSRDIDDPAERLMCTAWNGPSEGQALRRAARLADRVLLVVSSDAMRASELNQVKTRLGRQEAIGFVLVGVSDDIARLPDRAGPVEDFWNGRAKS